LGNADQDFAEIPAELPGLAAGQIFAGGDGSLKSPTAWHVAARLRRNRRRERHAVPARYLP